MSPSTTQALQSEPNKALHRTVNGAARVRRQAVGSIELGKLRHDNEGTFMD